MDISKTILLLKEKAGLSQKEIAKRLGSTPANVSYLSRGVHGARNPSLKVIQGLRQLLAEYKLMSE